MKFYSTKSPQGRATMREAIVQGLASDGGLYMPEKIEPFDSDYFSSLHGKDFRQISYEVAHRLLGDAIDSAVLKAIVDRAINFDAPLVEIEEKVWALELFHGPTLAFKDFGARFLAGLMEHYAANQSQEIVVLAATSGDTGSAVANGFLKVKGVRVIILYPSGKVSPLQEKQLTTLGHNITAWEVAGSFDDCQKLVKQLFLDAELKSRFLLTSANSINLGRLLPQAFYYFYAWAQLGGKGPVIFSVPSGNFGNLTAGVVASRLGLPVERFIAATNANDVVPAYLHGDGYRPRPSVATISNAMDVGDPSNFSRLLDLYGNDREKMAREITGYSFPDDQTREVISKVHTMRGYLLDPHGAVGYLGLKKYKAETENEIPGVFLETAHPGKFKEVVEDSLDKKIELPEPLRILENREKHSVRISNRYEEAKERLLAF